MALLKSSANPAPGLSRLKIVLVSHYYPPHLGGIERVVQQQAERLAKQGQAVAVVTSSCAASPGSEKVGGVRVLRARAWNPGEKKAVPFPIFSPAVFLTALRAIRPADIVHIHDVQYMSAWVAALCCLVTRTPYVVTQHVDVVHHPVWLVRLVQRLIHGILGRWILQGAAQVFILNDRVAAFARDSGVAPGRISLLANGVDTSVFFPATPSVRSSIRAQHGWGDSEIIAVFVGRPVPKKGFPLFQGITVPQVRLLVAGATQRDSEVEKVEYLGVLATAELARVFQGADLLILPSRDEGFPLVVQEAMAAGLPIVTSDDPAYSCYEFDSELLRQVPADLNALNEVVAELAADSGLRRLMGSYARSIAEEKFSWSGHLSTLLVGYARAVARS